MSESEQEKGYEVNDKRKVKLNENGEAEVQPETQAAGSKIEPEQQESQPEEENFNLPPVDVYSLLESFISVLAMNSWHWMGLVKNPATGKLDKDLSLIHI